MMELLTMPEAWIGFGLLGMVVYFLIDNAERKKQRARLSRITRVPGKVTKQEQDSLRRKNPNEGSILANISSIEKLQGKIEMAGLKLTLPQLLPRVVGVFIAIVCLLVFFLNKPVLLGFVVALALSVGGTSLYIKRRIRKRQMTFLKLFPEGIDLIVRGLRAGLPVSESFQVVSREIPPPVGDLFATISQQTQLGMPLEKALTDAARKIDTTEFDFFVTTIILQRETGGNLGEILSNLSDMLRQRQSMKLKIMALSSEARASAYIVGALPFCVFGLLSIVSPDYLDPLYNDARGNMSLMSAFGIMILGGFVMRRMTQLEI